MVPNPKWFPAALGARADWFNNFYVQFAIIAIELGFVLSDVTTLEADNQMMQFLVDANDQMNSVIDGSRQFRMVMTEGTVGSPEPIWPTQFAGSPPLPMVAAGIFERLDNLVKRIRVSPTYSPEIGALLGIIPSKAPDVAPNDMKPDPSLRAMPGNIVEADFVRGKTDGIDIQMMIDKSEHWENAGRFFKSPAVLNIPQNTENLPRSVQIRARYLIGNSPVGQYSDIDSIATIP